MKPVGERGLDRTFCLLCVGAVACSALLRVWLGTAGDLRLYVQKSMPAGQLFYATSRLAGLLALAALALQLIAVLIGYAAPTVRSSRTARFHARLGLCTFLLVVMHVACFGVAVRLRMGALPLTLLWPSAGQGYYRTHISLGALGFWALTLGIAVRLWPTPAWRKRVHWLAPIAWVPALCHGFAIGTETRETVPLVVFGGTAVCMFALGIYGILRERRTRRGWP